jgi:hypothetical protein
MEDGRGKREGRGGSERAFPNHLERWKWKKVVKFSLNWFELV